MVFRPRQRRQKLDLSIQIDNNNIDCLKETVFLGVILDEHLSWKPHILSVCRRISKSIGVIYKSSFCLPKTSLHQCHISLASVEFLRLFTWLKVSSWAFIEARQMFLETHCYDFLRLLQKKVTMIAIENESVAFDKLLQEWSVRVPPSEPEVKWSTWRLEV